MRNQKNAAKQLFVVFVIDQCQSTLTYTLIVKIRSIAINDDIMSVDFLPGITFTTTEFV